MPAAKNPYRGPYHELYQEIEAMKPGDTLVWNVQNLHSASVCLSRKERGRRYVYHPGCRNVKQPGVILIWYPPQL